jgi:soluble lytic murein transglycosylase-like protein
MPVSRALVFILLWLALCGAPEAFGYSLYGYEDEYGIVHLSETRLDDNYVLVFEGDVRPKLGFDAIKKLIRKKGGAPVARNDAWFKENVLRGSRRLWAGGGGGVPARDPATVDREIMASIKRASVKHRLDPSLIYAVIEQESNFEPLAVSHKGAQGIMQLTPDAQRFFGLSDPFAAAKNIEAGAKYLRYLLDKFPSTALALAAYNAGPAAVERYGDIPPFPETQTYVARVLQRYAQLKNL